MLEGVNNDLFADIYTPQGEYSASRHLAHTIGFLGPPPQAMLEKERAMRIWNFAPEVENSQGKLCRKAYEFYGGPFFDAEGMQCEEGAKQHYAHTEPLTDDL